MEAVSAPRWAAGVRDEFSSAFSSAYDADAGECTWPIDLDAACCDAATQDADPDVVARSAEVASVMLTRLSGYTIGACPATIRPLGLCPVCRTWCCGGTDGLRLTGPDGTRISDVTAVHLGAETLDPIEYRWDEPLQTLWRVPPETWPSRDERWAECGEDGAFCVEVIVGTPPDPWALSVAATLTCELIKSCLGAKCRLPANTTTVTQQGVTVVLGENDIATMLPEVAAWLAAVNPHKARLPAAVYSPEMGRPGRAAPVLPSWRSFPFAGGAVGGGCCGC